jgi:aryl-alcohol dehydrogenase-like predicted oxidoreductase
MLAKSPIVVPLVGARRPESIGDTAKAGLIELTDTDVATVEAALRAPAET